MRLERLLCILGLIFLVSGCGAIEKLIDELEDDGASVNPRWFTNDTRAASLANGTELTAGSEALIADYNAIVARSTSMMASYVVSTDWEDTTDWYRTYCRDLDCTDGYTKGLLVPDPENADSFRFDAVMTRNGVDLAKSVERTAFVRAGESGEDRTLGYNGLMTHGFFGAYAYIEDYDGYRNTVSGYSLAAGDMTGTNPAPGPFTWRGVMVGGNVDFDDGANLAHFLQGDAEITLSDLNGMSLGVSFTNIRDLHNGRLHDDMAWSGLRLERGAFAEEGLLGRIRGGFAGPNHEEVVGVFQRDNILGAFGGELGEMGPEGVFTGVLSDSRVLFEDAAKRVAASLPRFGGVTQSSNRNAAGLTTDDVDTTFDGRRFTLTVLREDGGNLTFDTSSLTPSRQKLLLRETDDSVSAALLTVDWYHPDGSNYLAGGVWMHLTGGIRGNRRFADAEMGTFVDGPALDDAPRATFPALGTARYHGFADGFYAINYGHDFEDIPYGSFGAGRFSGEVELTARFSSDGNTVEGCLGCAGETLLNGVFTDGLTNEEMDVIDEPAPIRLRVGPEPIDEFGQFRGRSIFVEGGSATVTSTGTWGGKFSGNESIVAAPLRVAGTFGGWGTLARGTQAALVGSYEAMGPWVHSRVGGSVDTGDGSIGDGDVVYGVGTRNGVAGPWFFGPAPQTSLVGNTDISGSVKWSGRLSGLAQTGEAVGGVAELTIEMATLAGGLNFTSMESWPVGQPEGAAGTGTLWEDGDLHYLVQAHGNEFMRTGGDPGDVSGAFFGNSHQAMGGVVERADLTGSFAGKR